MSKKVRIAIFLFLVFDVALIGLVIFKKRQPEPTLNLEKVQVSEMVKDATKRKAPSVASIKLIKTETLATDNNVKSVVFDPQKKYLYSLNLEGGSIYEYDRASREINRRLQFKQTKAKGYDYEKHKWLPNSFAEKPVEGCFTHEGKFLWASLHNAEGIVAWNIEDTSAVVPEGLETRQATLIVPNPKKDIKKTLHLSFFKTGKTPKVITASQDGRYLFVANWHSNSVSVLDIESASPQDWKVIKEIKVGSIPRGMSVSADGSRLFIGQMGSNTLSVIDLQSLEVVKKVQVGRTPRHLISDGRNLLISLSSPEKLLKVSENQLETLRKVSTKDDPRTIALSPDHSLLFVVCYSDDILQIFDAHTLNLLFETASSHKPVGVEIFQHENQIEAWVANYSSSTLKVFTLQVAYDPFL